MKFHCLLANFISWVKQSPMFFINSCYPQPCATFIIKAGRASVIPKLQGHFAK